MEQYDYYKRLIVVYDADGTFVGEVTYILGHFLGLRECSACDITHSLSQIGKGTGGEKPEWRELKKKLPIPVVQLHRNDLAPLQWKDLVHQLPLVAGERSDGTLEVVVSKVALEACDGDVSSLQVLIEQNLDQHLPPIKCAMRKRKNNFPKLSSTTSSTMEAETEKTKEKTKGIPWWFVALLIFGGGCVIHLIRMSP